MVTPVGPPVTPVFVSQCQVCTKLLERSEVSQCSRCHAGKYCSRACQKEHWGEHKGCCDAIVALEADISQKRFDSVQYKCCSMLTPKEQLKLHKLIGNKCSVRCRLDWHETDGLWDTGADVSLVGRNWLESHTACEIKPLSELVGEELHLSAANQTSIEYLGYVELIFEIAGCAAKKFPFLVVENLDIPIIGTNVIEEATRDCEDAAELVTVLSTGIKSLSKRKAEGLVNLIRQRQQNPEPDTLGTVKLNEKNVVVPGGTSVKISCVSHCGPVAEDMAVLFQPNLKLDLVNSGLVVGEGIVWL